MHVVWRGVIAVLVGCVVGSVVGHYLDEWTDWAATRAIVQALSSEERPAYPLVEITLNAYHALPMVIVAVVVFALLPRRRHDSETRCRNCGYILRGLVEPRCPECGEKI